MQIQSVRLKAFLHFVVFAIVVVGLLIGAGLGVRKLLPGMDEISLYILDKVLKIAIFLLASLAMAKWEGVHLADYGLPWRSMFGKRFWQGAVLAFGSLALCLGLAWIAGLFSVEALALHGSDIFKWGGLYGLAFVIIGFEEEFQYRGYGLHALSRALGFWPAALLLSVIFAAGHAGNAHEDWIGVANAGLAGLLFCFLLRRSGDLWLPIGFHTVWDWSESYFYGVADSGTVVPGHLLATSFHGPVWLTGGTVGPEGSVLVTLFLLLVGVVVGLWLREARYDPRAA